MQRLRDVTLMRTGCVMWWSQIREERVGWQPIDKIRDAVILQSLVQVCVDCLRGILLPDCLPSLIPDECASRPSVHSGVQTPAPAITFFCCQNLLLSRSIVIALPCCHTPYGHIFLLSHSSLAALIFESSQTESNMWL